MRLFLRWGPSILILTAASALGAVEERVVLRIEPGPETMSPQEIAITQDVGLGRQHGVILVEETLRDESRVLYREIAHHVRAKILSNEARSLADIVIPYETSEWYLKRWWGRTILPDGRMIELAREDLKEQPMLVGPGWTRSVRKGALPGVVPGCVIDYGYLLRGGGSDEWVTVPLQGPWPIREFRYQWFPAAWLPSQYFVRRSKGLEIEVSRQQAGVYIEGIDLPPATDEPWTPPDDQVRAGASLFYSIGRPSPDPNIYWNTVATDEEKKLGEFLGEPKTVKKALAKIEIPRDAPLAKRLEAAYLWLDRNIANQALRTAEERAADDEKLQKSDPEDFEVRRPPEAATAESVLSARAAAARDFRYLFVGLARALGAEAHLVMAADRRERLWERTMMSKGQLDYRVVAVREPGAPAQSATLVDPGSGLPYGSIRWWLAPTRALLAAGSKAEEIQIEPSKPEANALESSATIALPAQEGDPARVEWSARGSGQSGYEERLRLRKLEPTQRQERIDKLCGATADFEISRATAPELRDLSAPYHLECAGQLTTTRADDAQGRFAVPISGAWFPESPWFPSVTRTLPVVFPYLRVDRTTVELTAPPGYVAAPPPEAISLESPYANYSLRISKTERGYRAERTLTLKALVVALPEYDRLRGFFDKVRLADRTLVDFVRSGSAP